MIISKITPQKQHLNSVVFTDGSEILLDKDTCTENSLMADMVIDQDH